MSDVKTKPKTREKPKAAAHTVKNAPKTIKSVPYNVLRNAPSVMKEQLIKQKSEILSKTKQEEQTAQSPENYATDSVENAAYSTAATVYRTTRNVAEYKLKSYKAQKVKTKENYTMPDISVSPNVAENTPKLANNQPKTLQLTDGKIPPNSGGIKSQSNNAPKTVNRTPKIADDKKIMSNLNRIKFKDNTQLLPKLGRSEKTADNTEISRNLRLISPKAKEVYTEAQKSPPPSADSTPKQKAIQQAKVKAQQKAEIKAKENYIKHHSDDTDIKSPDTARRDYVRDKLKTKSEEQKRLQHTDAEIPTTAKTDIISNTSTIPPSDKPNIKTKENYMQSLRNDKTEPVKSAYKNAIAPKQKSSVVSRQLQSSSKAVHSKQKMTGKTVKDSRNVFKASRIAKKKTSKARKAAVKTQKQVTKQAAKQTAKMAKEAARRSAQAAKAAARATVRVAAKVAQAIVTATKALISAIAAGGPIAVVIVVLIVIIIVAAIVASPFGITISEEVTDAGTIPLSQIIAEYNVELTQETEDVELSVDHTEVEVVDNRTDNNVVIAVFAAKLAGAEDETAEDVVVFDDAKAENLKDFFRAANTVSHTVEETNEGEETKKKLTITITGKTKDELMDEYSLTPHQREAVEMLLENGDILTSSSHSLAITDADVQSIINGLPASLPQKRKDVVKNAGSLVGKVNYFWGGKSSAIGWDSAWGTMQRVTAAGSPSSGTIRAYGLDCSGYVTWAFNNSGMYVGDGTYGQRDRSVVVSASAVQAGDLCFLPSYSHVGIVVGKDASGNILVFHCSSSANNVVVSTASSVGFTVFRRPNCY